MRVAAPPRSFRATSPRPRAGVLPPVLACAVLAALAAPAAAQRPPTAVPCPQCIEVPSWVGQFTVLAGNAALGALSAGILQELRGGSFRDGFTRGAAGGAVVYAGKRLAVQEFDGSGLLGRQVAAVGSSMVRNAAEARPALARLWLPVGPVQLTWDRQAEEGSGVHARLDVLAAATLAWAAAEPQLELDWGRTLSAGAPVFGVEEMLMRGPGDDFDTTGMEVSGTILLSDIELFGREYRRRVFAHERVHVLQTDFFARAWTAPLMEWALEEIPGGRHVGRFLDFDMADVLITALEIAAFKSYEGRPWELEAEWLARR
ncbi:MAG TPA: hypothetical protein VMK65_00935 [Longimicrobiales bacterium]|nr:hypothetical protein [Longimicrobiales bacterium]